MKSNFLKQPWKLYNITTGVQIVEGNRVIVYIGEPNSKDNGPHRTKDVMERANLLLATPDLLEALKMVQAAILDSDDLNPAFRGEDLERINRAIAKAEGKSHETSKS